MTVDVRVEMAMPANETRPLFVYGLLKPRQLAFEIIKQFVSETRPATVSGTLRLRDGLPLLDTTAGGRVEGYLVSFAANHIEAGWGAVCAFEPRLHYRWADVVAVLHDGQCVSANALVGRSPLKGTAREPVQSWSLADDPVFTHGMTAVAGMMAEAVAESGRSLHSLHTDDPSFWPVFFRLQAAYLLLWSVIERYTALRFGPGLEPSARLTCLEKCQPFAAAVQRVGPSPDRVVDSRDPQNSVAVGTKPALYYYQLRSNLSHRGKSATQDLLRVERAVRDLHAIVHYMLREQFPHSTSTSDPVTP